jgi:hypothetical protein
MSGRNGRGMLRECTEPNNVKYSTEEFAFDLGTEPNNVNYSTEELAVVCARER